VIGTTLSEIVTGFDCVVPAGTEDLRVVEEDRADLHGHDAGLGGDRS